MSVRGGRTKCSFHCVAQAARGSGLCMWQWLLQTTTATWWQWPSWTSSHQRGRPWQVHEMRDTVHYSPANPTSSGVHRLGPGRYGGEAFFVPRQPSEAEDDGWLLNYVFDVTTQRSDLVVVDARSMEEVARVHLPARVPYGFHTLHVPEAALDSQAA